MHLNVSPAYVEWVLNGNHMVQGPGADPLAQLRSIRVNTHEYGKCYFSAHL